MRCIIWIFVFGIGVNLVSAQDDSYTVTTLVRGVSNVNLEGLAFDNQRNVLYTPSGPAGQVFQITAKDGIATQVLGGIGFPQGGAVDRNGNYYVSSWTSGQILKYDPSASSVEVFATGPQGPTGLAIDPSGDTLYIANWSNSTIYKAPLSGGRLTRFVEGPGINNPDGLAFDAEGNLYVAMAQAGNGRIMRVTVEGNVSLFVDIDDTQNTGYIAVHADVLYVSGHGSNKIYAVDLPSQSWRVLAGTGQWGRQDGKASEATFSNPQGIAISPDGLQIYVVDPPNRAIRVVSKTLTDVVLETEQLGIQATLAQNYPNPFKDSTTISFALPQSQSIRVDLYTMTGQRVRLLAQGLYPAGNHQLNIRRQELAAGRYLVRLTTPTQTLTRTLTVLR